MANFHSFKKVYLIKIFQKHFLSFRLYFMYNVYNFIESFCKIDAFPLLLSIFSLKINQ